MSLTCPKCGVISTDEDFNNGTEKCAVYTNNAGNLVCECWECENEWEESS